MIPVCCSLLTSLRACLPVCVSVYTYMPVHLSACERERVRVCVLCLQGQSGGPSPGLCERDGAPVREEGLANHSKPATERTCALGRPSGQEERRGEEELEEREGLTQIVSIKMEDVDEEHFPPLPPLLGSFPCPPRSSHLRITE